MRNCIFRKFLCVPPPDTYRIGPKAFAHSNLQCAMLPQGLHSIGEGAFTHCTYLTQVSIPDSVEDIEDNVFSYTPWLSAQTGPFTIVGKGLLLRCNFQEENLVIPEHVRKICAYACEQLPGSTSFRIPEAKKASCRIS